MRDQKRIVNIGYKAQIPIVRPDISALFHYLFAVIKGAYIIVVPAMCQLLFQWDAEFKITVIERFSMDLEAIVLKVNICVRDSFYSEHPDNRPRVFETPFLKLITTGRTWLKNMPEDYQFLVIGIAPVEF